MDNSPLNEAHYQHRRADIRLRQRRYDDAIICHKRAAEKLLQVLSRPIAPRALFSVQLQIKFHNKQQELISVKKQQQEYHTTRSKETMARFMDKVRENMLQRIKTTLDKNISDAKTLLKQLKKKIESKDPEAYECIGSEEVAEATLKKAPKTETDLVQEVQDILLTIQENVAQLYVQLENAHKENYELKVKCKVPMDEFDLTKYGTSPTSPRLKFQREKQDLHSTSETMFKFSDEESMGETPITVLPVRPAYSPVDIELPPLPMPEFDYKAAMRDLKLKRERQHEEAVRERMERDRQRQEREQARENARQQAESEDAGIMF